MNFIEFLKENKKGLLFVFLTWGVFFAFLWPQLLFFDQNGDLLSGWPIIWADWAMHISQVSNFVYRPFLSALQNHHLYSGIALNYPFGVNLISAWLMKAGLSLTPALIIPSIIFSWFLLLALYIFGKSLFKKSRVILLGIHLFLTGGGMGFLFFCKDFSTHPNLNTILFPPQEYTRMLEENIYWYTTLVATFIPQRAMLLGFPIGLLVLAKLFGWYQKKWNKIELKSIFKLGLVTGLLAWIHPHTLLAIFFISLVLFLIDYKNIKYWLGFGLGTIVTAAPFFLLIKGLNGANFLRWYPGWLTHNNNLDVSFLEFWLKNWGLLLPLFLVALLIIAKKKTARYTSLFLTFLILFIISNLFLFQPYDWDNAKLLMWVYCGCSFLVAWLLNQLWQKNVLAKIVAVLLFIILTASGTLDLLNLLKINKHTNVMLTKQEISLAAQFRKISNPNDIVLTDDYHLNWVAMLSGRPIVMGYRGWLWSYGIDYGQRELDISSIYQGSDNALALLQKYQITYVLLDNETKTQWHSNESFFAQNFPLVLQQGEYKMFKIK